MRRADIDTIRHPVILFDGVCNLCNGWVNFVINRDPAGVFHFAPLQSEGASDLLHSGTNLAANSAEYDSIVLLDGGQVFEKSDAVLRIASELGRGWPLLSIFRVIPSTLRDKVYDIVAGHRYSWFG